MEFSRGKVQILYNYLPGAIFPHDSYGFCRVTGIDLQIDTTINLKAVADAVSDTLQHWRNDWQRSGFPEIRDASNMERRYIVGVPTHIRFAPYPEMFQCQQCRRVYSLDELKRRRISDPRRCPAEECGGNLAQLPFAQAHNCGRLEELYINRQGCRFHGTSGLYFDDTGRVTTARWRCHLCGGAEVARLRQTPCRCDYSELGTSSDSARRLRVFSVTDPALFRPWVVPFVNFNQEELSDLSASDVRPAVIGRLWNIIKKPVKEFMADISSSSSDAQPELEELVHHLEELQPDHPKVKEWRERQRTAQTGAKELDRVMELAGTREANSLTVSRRMTEHVAILDTLNATTVDTVVHRLRDQGEHKTGDRMQRAIGYAESRLGIRDIQALEDFPVGLCAIGYTRVTKSPQDSVLNPFPQFEGRTPLYSVTTTTEGLYFQLDPLRVVTWLQENNIIAGSLPSDEMQAWGWLYRFIPGLRQTSQQPDYSRPEAVAVRTLLHSISHVLLRNIEWSGYAAQSLGEYLLPEGLACVLYANRYTDTKVGGLLTLFEQELQEWLEAAFQEGTDCVFDPFCTEGGGSCVGCLHREFNCPDFNRELSRATLYGGPITQEGAAALPFGDIQRGYWN